VRFVGLYSKIILRCTMQCKQSAYTDACKTHYTIIVYTTVLLKMNP